MGGSVSIATGGAEGTYLEVACTTAADLAGAYTKILDASGTNLLDIDIEHDVQIDKVIDALGQVQRARQTDITLTLPVDLAGLGPGQLNLVKKAAATNLAIRVNIMNMNFEASGDRGKALVRAARAMLAQIRKVYPNATAAEQNRMLSITLMIGRNDTGEITRAADVQTVLDFAKANGVGRVGFWSLGRDRGTCPGQAGGQPDCSGIAQADYQFTKQFAAYTGPTPDSITTGRRCRPGGTSAGWSGSRTRPCAARSTRTSRSGPRRPSRPCAPALPAGRGIRRAVPVPTARRRASPRDR